MSSLNVEISKKKFILFGAGKRGKEALERIGEEKVAYFCDNDIKKVGTQIKSIDIISFESMTRLYSEKYVIVVTLAFPCFVIGQLEKAGIREYLLYQDYTPEIIHYDNKESAKEKKHNDILRNFVIRSAETDLLENIYEFRKLTKEALKYSYERNIPLNYLTRGYEEEGYRYGNLQTIERYASIDVIEGAYVPIVSHVLSMPIYSPAFKYKTAVIIPGEYYKSKIHQRAPWVPVFTVGPYIHYAKEIYDFNLMLEKKNKIGTMLLAFLPHSLENVNRDYDRRRFVDMILKKYQMEYNEIWLCVYFADINDDVCDYAEDKGIHIVTAGFRFDPFFNDRLKTIIQLCDAVVCGDIGGFLTYSILMGKPVSRIEISDRTSLLDIQYGNETERNIEKTEDYLSFEHDFYDLLSEKARIDNNQREWMNPVAGFNLIKNKEYIHSIFSISKDIWEACEDNIRRYPEAVKKVYYNYNNNDEFEKMFILKQAVGAFLD